MGSAVFEMGLELELCATRIVGDFVKEVSAIESGGSGRASRLEESIKFLEEEKRKIEAFRREVPICMRLLREVIERLRREIERCRCESFGHVFGEFMPLKSKVEDDGGVKVETDCRDKMNWMSSVQLWSDNYSENDDEEKIVSNEQDGAVDHRQGKGKSLECKSRSSGVEFLPFKALSPLAASSEEEEEKPASALPELSLQSPAINRTLDLVTPVALGDHRGFGGFRKATEWVPATLGLQSRLQPPRKARRCWSQELHRRFVLAIQQLGGAQVATPKQIRELMKVDGLTNDEVKSHLQKYRLHIERVHAQRLPNAVATADRAVVVLGGLWDREEQYTSSSQQSFSQSGSPMSPFQLAGSR
ncbi:transcription factor NIGTH1-like isoform X1 [Musa acuminata AAA Group]|uniref:transcription factor NIGTH1-like isoform X1 n=1 Tax=Musa acuminata AAA Group TaxID=214697 RepID=UPI0031D21766